MFKKTKKDILPGVFCSIGNAFSGKFQSFYEDDLTACHNFFLKEIPIANEEGISHRRYITVMGARNSLIRILISKNCKESTWKV